MTKFVIAATQRTGSTMLVTLLDSHPRVLCLGESFKCSTGNTALHHQEKSYAVFRNKTMGNRLQHYLRRKTQVKGYLDRLYATTNFDAIGFKMMYNQSMQFPSLVPYLMSNNIRVIHISRDNPLEVLVSLQTARARRLFHSREHVKVEPVVIPLVGLTKQLEKIRQYNRKWTEVFSENHPYLKIDYNSFSLERDHHVERILDFLQLEQQKLSTPLVKINPADFSLAIKNYHQVKDYLINTEFAYCVNGQRESLSTAASSINLV